MKHAISLRRLLVSRVTSSSENAQREIARKGKRLRDALSLLQLTISLHKLKLLWRYICIDKIFIDIVVLWSDSNKANQVKSSRVKPPHFISNHIISHSTHTHTQANACEKKTKITDISSEMLIRNTRNTRSEKRYSYWLSLAWLVGWLTDCDVSQWQNNNKWHE